MATKRGYLGRSVDSWGSVLGSWPGYFVRCRLIYQQRDRQKKNPVKSLRAGTRPSTAGSPGGMGGAFDPHSGEGEGSSRRPCLKGSIRYALWDSVNKSSKRFQISPALASRNPAPFFPETTLKLRIVSFWDQANPRREHKVPEVPGWPSTHIPARDLGWGPRAYQGRSAAGRRTGAPTG